MPEDGNVSSKPGVFIMTLTVEAQVLYLEKESMQGRHRDRENLTERDRQRKQGIKSVKRDKNKKKLLIGKIKKRYIHHPPNNEPHSASLKSRKKLFRA